MNMMLVFRLQSDFRLFHFDTSFIVRAHDFVTDSDIQKKVLLYLRLFSLNLTYIHVCSYYYHKLVVILQEKYHAAPKMRVTLLYLTFKVSDHFI